MSAWVQERRSARTLRSRSGVAQFTAGAVIAAVEELTGIGSEAVFPGHPLLDGGNAQLDAGVGMIWYSDGIDHELVPFYLAHEYAHLWLNHGGCWGEARDVDPEIGDASIDAGVERVQGYSPRERRERAANIFAQELLLPTPLLRDWFLEEGLGAAAIALRTELPLGLVRRQLSAALLDADTDPLEESMRSWDSAASTASSEVPELMSLDESQARAAHVDRGPFLLEAGPGTGKTRTLIARVLHLLEQGIRPDQIVVLTFSNRAATEIRDRVALTAPAAAADLWVGTFHAFGLELLRQYGTRIGRPHVDVLDPFQALQFLEENLIKLDLSHYRKLSYPSQPLGDIAKAISRAKDELCGPGAYRDLAGAMLSQAQEDDDAEAGLVAEKALEVAGVYHFYQEHLVRNGLVDFGDLIARTVDMLRLDSVLRHEVRKRYQHVLVDEYQDVNHASTELLRELAGEGEGLWVVGDPRQAIYRFRGADPSNMARFPEYFPTAGQSALGFNYRSLPAIVETISGLAGTMPVGATVTPWQPKRTEARGEVILGVAATFAGEMAGMVAEIGRRRAAGVRLRDQAVLCRAHTSLGRVGDELKAAGVPTQYFGNLFERPETRDLLALLSLVAQADGVGLLRVAAFPEYSIPTSDVTLLLDAANRREMLFPQALSLAPELPELSARGRAGFKRLSAHLDRIPFVTGPWGFLSRYLFEESRYLVPLVTSTSAEAAVSRWALLAFLEVVHGYERDHRTAGLASNEIARLKSGFLKHVRDLQIYGEERQYRQPPELPDGIDAIRLMTVHASKGLEFPVVYLPYLGGRYMPQPAQAVACPPPNGMIINPGPDNETDELNVFFVALSRAKDALCLSRSNDYLGSSSRPSKFLARIQPWLPGRPDGPPWWPDPVACSSTRIEPEETGEPDLFSDRELETYIRCPRQYYYDRVLRLEGRFGGTASLRFHRAIHRTMRWMEDVHAEANGRPPELDEIHEQLEEIWAEVGPSAHPYEPLYRDEARRMVTLAAAFLREREGRFEETPLVIPIGGGRVHFRPHQIERTSGSALTIRRIRTGRAPKTMPDDNRDALYVMGSGLLAGRVDLEVVYLGGPQIEIRPLTLTTAKRDTRIGRYRDAIAGIAAGDFPAKPDRHECPGCPFYFICPAPQAPEESTG